MLPPPVASFWCVHEANWRVFHPQGNNLKILGAARNEAASIDAIFTKNKTIMLTHTV